MSAAKTFPCAVVPGVVAKIHVINLPIKKYSGQGVKKVCLLRRLGDGFVWNLEHFM